jgi:hypothetical protein
MIDLPTNIRPRWGSIPRLHVWGRHGWKSVDCSDPTCASQPLPLHDECSQPIFGSEAPTFKLHPCAGPLQSHL